MQIALTESEAKHLRELLRSAAVRREHNQFVLEGPHLIEEALKHGAEFLEMVIFTPVAELEHADLVRRAGFTRIKIRTITEKLCRKISETEAPQGIFGLVLKPEHKVGIGQIVLALDGVQDPGNVGTLIRTAAWFGVSDILLGQGTADPFAPKVVRATQGAIFSARIERTLDLAKRIAKLKAEGYHVLITSLDSTSTNIHNLPRFQRVVVVLGSEAHGVASEIAAIADTKAIIPSYGNIESLNVAVSGGIVLSELVRKLG